MKSKTLHEAALDLPPNERADLARKLLLSLDDPSEEELAQTWLLEAEQRAGEIDRGEVEPVSAEEVRRKARIWSPGGRADRFAEDQARMSPFQQMGRSPPESRCMMLRTWATPPRSLGES